MGYILDLRKTLGQRPLIMSGAGVVILNDDNKILLQKRVDNGFWGIPAGSMELGESFEECARREVLEETGLTLGKLEIFATESGRDTHYTYPNGDEVYVAAVFYICRDFKGELKATDGEVLTQGFFDVEDLPDNIDPINEPIIRRVAADIKNNGKHSLKKTYTETIYTDRLILRKFEYSDVDSMLKNWISKPEVQLNYGEPVCATSEEVKPIIDEYINGYNNPNYYRWAVIEKESGECIGQIAYFLVDTGNKFAEIEYCIGTAYQGRGYATESCRSVIDYGFNTIGLHKVQICARPSNTASRKVIEKCGFIYEGELRDYFRMEDGSFEGRMYYSLMREEWEYGKRG